MRTVMDLNTDWEFALHRGFGPVEKGEADDLQYRNVTLPHDWAVSSPLHRQMEEGEQQGFFDRWGIGWYRRILFLSEKDDKSSYWLCFDGIYENSTVWVNDTAVGGRKYGYSSFRLDITRTVREGENRIVVKVDNTAVPADRWYSGAGIYRKVFLEILPEEHLEKEEIQVITEVTKEAAAVTVYTGTDGLVKAFLTAPECGKDTGEDEKASEKFVAEGRGEISFTIADPVLWSAETPSLYRLCLKLTDGRHREVDRVVISIGLRQIKLDGNRGLSVNGHPEKLKGVCLHQEAGCFGTAVQPEIWRERLKKLKEIGCNALRLAHHIFMPEILDLCDEMGFYVYEECFDKWTGGAYGRYYHTEWEKDISCMVKRDRNHPCILFWGVGNEVENQAHPTMLALLERHVAKVKELDPSRMVSVAMNPHFSYPEAEVDLSKVADIQQYVDEMKTGEIFDVDEKVEQIRLIAEKTDLICCNYQEQWYEKIHSAIPEKAILGTETYIFFRGCEDKFQNFTAEIPWMDVEQKDYCIGGMLWAGIDYLGESMGYPARGWSGALFASDMEKRYIAWLYQCFWTKEPTVYFAVMDQSCLDLGIKEHWDFPRYECHWEFPHLRRAVLPYMIATNCEQAELWVNEKEFLLRPTAEYPNRMITGFLPYIPGTVTVIGKNKGVEVCRQEIRTPGQAVKLRFEEEEQEIYLREGTGFQKILRVRAFDREEIPVFRESGKVVFSVQGPAYIAGVDNGDIQRSEPYDGSQVHLFQGRADVALVITGTGRIKVTACAAGMEMAQSVIVSK